MGLLVQRPRRHGYGQETRAENKLYGPTLQILARNLRNQSAPYNERSRMLDRDDESPKTDPAAIHWPSTISPERSFPGPSGRLPGKGIHEFLPIHNRETF